MAIRGAAVPDRYASRDESRKARSATERPRLGVLDRRQLVARAERRQVKMLVLLAGLALAGSLVTVAAGRALVASEQVRVDSLQTQIGHTLATQQDLQLKRAALETPERIEEIARHELGMVAPATVTYLAAVDPGKSVAEAHARNSAHHSSSRRSRSARG
ncbi:MAG: septum formation initiator family protein [Acidimicrobiales bacterium]